MHISKILLASAAALCIASVGTPPAAAHDFNLNAVVALQDADLGPQAAAAAAYAGSAADKASANASALNVGNVLSADLNTQGDGVVVAGALVGQFANIESQAAAAGATAIGNGAASATAQAMNVGNAITVTSALVGH